MNPTTYLRCLFIVSTMLHHSTVAWMSIPPPQAPSLQQQQHIIATAPSTFNQGISSWLLATTPDPPSSKDIQLLRQAFAEYSASNYDQALPLFNDVVIRWKDQPDDERASLYRTRADTYFQLADASMAYKDYDTSLQLMDVDNDERPGALLGRARAAKVMGQSAIADYRAVLQLLGADPYDDEQPVVEQIQSGIEKNPFAAWEYADCLRSEKQYVEAGTIREAAARTFRQIGDSSRSVMAMTDAGVDYAGDAKMTEKAITVLRSAVDSTKGVEGRDVKLLQRVISKEGEGRMALASLLWTTNQKNAAESVLGDACLRMDQLLNQMDGTASTKSTAPANGLRYSMEDDDQLVGSLTCTRFRNKEFLAAKLKWPESLQDRVLKLESLK